MGYSKTEYTIGSMNKLWSPIYKHLRDSLRNVREQANLTQVQLAVLLKKPQSYISKIESGERKVDVLEVRNYCQACGVSWLSFLNDLEKKIDGVE